MSSRIWEPTRLVWEDCKIVRYAGGHWHAKVGRAWIMSGRPGYPKSFGSAREAIEAVERMLDRRGRRR